MTGNRCHPESAAAALIADQLGLGRILNSWSMAVALMGGAALLMAAQNHNGNAVILFSAALLSAVVQLYYAARTQLDAAIFRRWADAWRHLEGSSPEVDMTALDRALGKDAAVCRPLADRIHGARRLLLRQSICFSMQVAAVLAGCWLLV